MWGQGQRHQQGKAAGGGPRLGLRPPPVNHQLQQRPGATHNHQQAGRSEHQQQQHKQQAAGKQMQPRIERRDGQATTAPPGNDTTDKPKLLPVQEARANVIKLIRSNRVCVIVGETGSGKTTQIPQFILDEVVEQSAKPGAKPKGVCCTQPRRVAAITIAQYVAKTRGCQLGEEVGYAVRFQEMVSPATRLKFVTDGILLREILADPMLRKYGCIILDEAHERTLHGDVLFGLLKQLTVRRADLRVIIMSATLNAQQFSMFWNNAPVGFVEGRTYPVTVHHASEPQLDYVDAAINAVIQVHLEEAFPGDILCFLTGQDEIEDVKAVLTERRKLLPPGSNDMHIVALYSALNPNVQLQAFEPAPAGARKIILATNIAETSITIEGIKYVVDAGNVKARTFDPDSTLDSLQVTPISRAQARQRTGRAGRVAAGKCFRLYTEESFEEDMPENTVPEILRCNLDSVTLQMLAMGITNILGFEFMDPPSTMSLLRALQQLTVLQAIDAETHAITPLGRQMVKFPVEPKAARAILRGMELGVTADVCAVMAMLSSDASLFTGGGGQHGKGAGNPQGQEDVNRSKFNKALGDHITLLHIFDSYRKQPVKERQNWCEAAGINGKQMQRTLDVFVQLMEICRGIEAEMSDAEAPTKAHRQEDGERKKFTGLAAEPLSIADSHREHELLRTAVVAGYFMNAAFFSLETNGYVTLIGRQPVTLHPSSTLFHVKKKPPIVVFHTILRTGKVFLREVTAIREEWLALANPTMYGGGKATAQAAGVA